MYVYAEGVDIPNYFKTCFFNIQYSQSCHRPGSAQQHCKEEDQILSPDIRQKKYSSLERIELELWSRGSDISQDGSLYDNGVFASGSSACSPKRVEDSNPDIRSLFLTNRSYSSPDQRKADIDLHKPKFNGRDRTQESLKSLDPIFICPKQASIVQLF